MIQDRMKVLASLYIDRYADLTSGNEDVRDKWAAVSNCVKKWNLAAEDFSKMFSEAMEKGAFLIDHGDVHPLEGIRKLCSAGRTEEVREAFADLLANDHGDIQNRQDRVSLFVKKINDMINEEFPDKWMYKQKVRTAIKYLGLIHPEDNYIFKASAAAAFAGYCDEDSEIGYDRKLKLSNYYNMCDELVEYLQNREDLLKTVAKGLLAYGKAHGDTDLGNIDPALHILAYDVISSAYRYGFYLEKKANRKSKISVVQQRKIKRARRAAELLDTREDVVDTYEQIESLEHRAKIPTLQGRRLHHKAFGDGKVMEQDGRYLTVVFPNDLKKKFALPGVITNGFLEIGNSEKILEACDAMEEVRTRRQKFEDALTSIDVQLSMLE